MANDQVSVPTFELRGRTVMPRLGYGTLGIQSDREHSDSHAALTAAEMAEVDALDRGPEGRMGPHLARYEG